MFAPCRDFDWNEFDNPSKGQPPTITEDTMRELFQGRHGAARKTLVADLEEMTGCSQSAAYNALRLDGRFNEHLQKNDGLWLWTE